MKRWLTNLLLRALPSCAVSGTTCFTYLHETLRVIISAVLETADADLDRQTTTVFQTCARLGPAFAVRIISKPEVGVDLHMGV